MLRGLGDTGRLSWDGAGQGNDPKAVFIGVESILYHFYIIFCGVMGAQSTGWGAQLGEKMEQLVGMMPKEGERRARSLGWAFLVASPLQSG